MRSLPLAGTCMGGTVWCACVGMILLLPSVPAAGAKAGDFYHTLGVDKGATAKEIKKAYSHWLVASPSFSQF